MMKSRFLLSTVAAAAIAGGIAMQTTPAAAVSFVSTQATGEQSTSSLIGLKVENSTGENLGDINYLVINDSGAVSTVVIGVGGFLGVAEKNVGVPYADISITTNKDGKRVAVLSATKENLTAAPAYVWTEKSTMETIKEGASDLADRAKKAATDATEKAKEIVNEPATKQ